MFTIVARLTAVALFASATIATACSSGSSTTLDAYFPRVATLASALEKASPSPSANGSFAPSESSLRAFASGLDMLAVPGAAKQPHHDLTVATKNVADLQHRVLAGISRTPEAEAGVVRDWQTACHVLQDLALAKKLDVDLRCATALHLVDSGG
jgi:hypothetical protein